MNVHATPCLMSKDRVVRVLRIALNSVHKLVDRKILVTARVNERAHGLKVVLREDDDLVSVYGAYLQRLEEGGIDAHAIETYKDARRLLKVPTNGRHPTAVLKFVARMMAQLGVLRYSEASSWIPISRDKWDDVRSALLEYYQAELIQRWRFSPEHEIDAEPETAAEILPDAIRALPFTCLHPRREHEYAAPERSVLARAMACGVYSDAAVIFALATAPTTNSPLVRQNQLRQIVQIVESMEARFGPGRWTQAQFSEFFDDMLEDKDPHPSGISAYGRLTLFRTWKWFVHRLHRYANRVDGELGSAIRHILPPRYRRSHRQRRAETKLVKVARAKARIRRKDRSRRLKDDLDPISECVRNRAGCARLIGETVRHAIAGFAPDQDHVDVAIDLPTLDCKGLHTGGWQTEHLRVWRFDAAWKSLASGWIPVSMRNSMKMVFSRDVDRGFVVEVTGCDPLTAYDTRECWLFEIGRTFCHAQIGQLPVEFKLARHATMLKYRLPVVTAAMTGLIKLDQDRSSLPRNAAILGRTFIPIEEMCHAVRLGGLAIGIGYQTQARELEILQTQVSGWQRDDITTDRAHYSQPVIPKTSGFRELENVEELRLLIDQATMDEVLDLYDLELSRTGAAVFPTSRFPPEIGWKLGPGQYTFSHVGKVMRAGFLRTCLAYVTAGWPRFTIHDLRHALNEEAEDEGVEDFVRAARLGHGGQGALKTYDGLKLEEDLDDDEDGVARRIHRLEAGR